MEYIKEININEAIMHVLDINGGEPVLDDMRIRLDETAYSYIYKLLCKVAKDECLMYAKFNEDSEINKLAMQYFKYEKDLVEMSKDMAIDMFNILKSECKSSTDLLVVSISTEYGSMVAILKMDYAEQYNHKIEFLDDKIGVNILPQNYLPKSVKQAAFIKAMRVDGACDLMVLNKIGDVGFEKQFLKCKPVMNERDKTREFMYVTERFIKTNLRDNAAMAEKARKTIRENLKDNGIINLNELAEKIFLENEENKNNFIESLKEAGIKDKVDIDKQYIEKKLSNKKLKLDADIELSISGEAYNDLHRFEVQDNLDGSINLVIKNIKNYSEK